MRLHIILIICRAVVASAFKNKAVTWLTIILGLMLFIATWLGWNNYQQQQKVRIEHQELVRKQWVSNPDKHPHRMAHYGYFAFRSKHPLSFFDFGMESFTGVSLFLEAHKQNTINFSEASLSTGNLRFGEMSIAMLLQLLIPLLLLFLGFNSISTLKENGTLKIILCQGVIWQELILGKVMGITAVALAIYLPVILITICFWISLSRFVITSDAGIRLSILLLSYLIYFIIWSFITVLISSLSKTSKGSLITLIGIWLITMIVLPRGAQAIGAAIYRTPSKAAFEAALEEDLKKDGDRHNPNDPYFKAIKDSLLHRYNVDSVSQLPFNYAGFLMFEGEKKSSQIYNHHRKELLKCYQQQNSFNRYTSFINPYIAIKNLSMALSGADFASYMDFHDQAENFRYGLAQRMNKLQMDHISNKKQGDHDKPYSISNKHWKEMPDFKYEFKDNSFVFQNEAMSLAALLFWLAFPIMLLFISTKMFKSL